MVAVADRFPAGMAENGNCQVREPWAIIGVGISHASQISESVDNGQESRSLVLRGIADWRKRRRETTAKLAKLDPGCVKRWRVKETAWGLFV